MPIDDKSKSFKRKRRPSSHLPPGREDLIIIQNVNAPGETKRVDARKYQAMRDAILRILPHSEPGLTEEEALAAVLSHLPEGVFAEREGADWWLNTVKLDLEAKGIIIRESSISPRWHQR
jgi:hypothetical protein